MARTFRLPVRSLGSEVGTPAVPELAAWVGTQRDRGGDLITYQLETSLSVQAEVDLPAPGGLFYAPRMLASLEGLTDQKLKEELACRPDPCIEDVLRLRTLRKELWWSLPAPHLLDIRDGYYLREEEFESALSDCYRDLLRAMRDQGCRGHVLLAREGRELELESLAGPRTLFHLLDPDPENIPALLEHQTTVVIPGTDFPDFLGLLEEYDPRHLVLLNPPSGTLRQALQFFDPDELSVGGYCERDCAIYWKDLVSRATVTP